MVYATVFFLNNRALGQMSLKVLMSDILAVVLVVCLSVAPHGGPAITSASKGPAAHWQGNRKQ